MKRFLYLVSEQWPTHRADMAVLFGKYLPRHGVFSDIVTERDAEQKNTWQGGRAILCRPFRSKAVMRVTKFLYQTSILLRRIMFAFKPEYDAVQVRDMIWIALVALLVCKFKKIPFYYWLSYPHSEGQIDRAKVRGVKAGVKFFGPLIQGYAGQYLLYRWILPHADHVFVQTPVMQELLEAKGVSGAKMTPVLMGVDIEALQTLPPPIDDQMLIGKRALVYLGTLDRARKIEVLFEMMALLKEKIPDALLVLVGDTEDAEHRAWLQSEVKRLDVEAQVLWTGWLPTNEAWRYVAAAEIGLSPIPRGYLLDMGSPTKAIEYMAIGIPTVMNDNPDQAKCAMESGSGICVPLTADKFSQACVELLSDAEKRRIMSKRGQAYVMANRSYQQIAKMLADKYVSLS